MRVDGSGENDGLAEIDRSSAVVLARGALAPPREDVPRFPDRRDRAPADGDGTVRDRRRLDGEDPGAPEDLHAVIVAESGAWRAGASAVSWRRARWRRRGR